jgi:4-aminobutyrate aminotransferase
MTSKIIHTPGNNSINLYKKATVIGATQNACLYGVALEEGNGNYVIDVDGNKYLDFLSGAASNSIGYGRKDVVDTYAKTAMRLQHSCFVYNFNRDAIELAEKLTEITPGNFEKKVLFGISGSSSIDGAIKVARKYTRKKGVISFNNSYHGSTGFAIQATHLINLTAGFFLDELDEGFYHVPFPIKEEDIPDILLETETLLKKRIIGAFLVEPIQGDAGVLIPPKNFFKQLYNLLKEYDALFMVDEIQTGAGRTGKWWGIDNFDVVPDILICGKGISGGYAPISAVIGDGKIIDSLIKTQHLFTYSGHPPSCAVTKKVLDIIEQEKLMENALRIEILLRRELEKLKDYSVVKDFRGIGLMLGLEFAGESLAGLAAMRCVEYGLYPGYYGKYNEVLRLQPPLTLTEKEALWAVEIIKKVIEEIENKEVPIFCIEDYTKYACGSICSSCEPPNFYNLNMHIEKR